MIKVFKRKKHFATLTSPKCHRLVQHSFKSPPRYWLLPIKLRPLYRDYRPHNNKHPIPNCSGSSLPPCQWLQPYQCTGLDKLKLFFCIPPNSPFAANKNTAKKQHARFSRGSSVHCISRGPLREYSTFCVLVILSTTTPHSLFIPLVKTFYPFNANRLFFRCSGHAHAPLAMEFSAWKSVKKTQPLPARSMMIRWIVVIHNIQYRGEKKKKKVGKNSAHFFSDVSFFFFSGAFFPPSIYPSPA